MAKKDHGADGHFRAGRYREALALYEKIYEETPTPEILSNQAYCLQQLGRHAECLEKFEAVLKERPGNAHILKAMCYSAGELEDYRKMLQCAQQAAGLLPEDDYVFQQMAIAEQNLGNLEAGLEAAEKALRLNPDNAYARYHRDEILLKLGRTVEPPDAQAALPDLPGSHAHLGFPELHRVLRPFGAKIAETVRPAWLVRAERAENPSPFESHFGGRTPFVPEGPGWPECPVCKGPAAHLWQVDLKATGSSGLFQVFACLGCPKDEGSINDRFVFRHYPDFDPSAGVKLIQAPAGAPAEIGSRAIIEPFLSVPSANSKDCAIRERRDEMVLADPKEGEERRLWAVYNFTEEFVIEEPLQSRIGGHPPWIQPAEPPPPCPVCGAEQAFVGAIGSDDTDILYGDSGYFNFFTCTATPRCPGLPACTVRHQCY